MNDGPFSVSSWEQFLPPNAVLMARRVVLLFEVPGLDQPVQRELFEKIMLALQLAPADYRVVDASDARAVVRFVASEGDALTPGVTYSLSAMLKKPDLKKPVWAHLKEALKK